MFLNKSGTGNIRPFQSSNLIPLYSLYLSITFSHLSIQYNLFGKESIESLITKSVLHASLLAHGVSNATFTNDDFQELGRSLRSYTLLSTLIDKGRIAEYNIMEKVPVFYKNRGSALLQRLQHNLHNQLFPWYDETIEFSGKGLVFLVGKNSEVSVCAIENNLPRKVLSSLSTVSYI